MKKLLTVLFCSMLVACAPQKMRMVDAKDDVAFVTMYRAMKPAMLERHLVDEAGNRTLVDRVLLNNTHISKGQAYHYNTLEMNVVLTEENVKAFMEDGKTYSLCLEVAISNGQNFTLAQVDGLSK